MAFVEVVDPAQARDALAAHYELGRRSLGAAEPPRLFQAWSLQAGVAMAWLDWHREARARTGLSPVEYELMECRLMYQLRSRYVLVNHAAILAKLTGWDIARLRAAIHAPESADLAPREKALITFAGQVATASHRLGPHDIAALRPHGFDDAQVVALVFVIGSLVLNAILPNALGAELDEFSQPYRVLADWNDEDA